MIRVEFALAVHGLLIKRFGGAVGLREKGLLEAALARPYQTFDGKELYADPISKAAAVFESLIENHPFVDGNKRVAYVLMRLTLLEAGLDIHATQLEKYEFVMSAAEGQITRDEIENWLHRHTRSKRL